RHPLPVDEALQGLALEVFQDHVRELPVLTDVMDDDDVFVAAAGGGPRLQDEALRELCVRGLEELDGHAPAQLHVSREEALAHSPAADLADELVLVDHRSWGQDACTILAGLERRHRGAELGHWTRGLMTHRDVLHVGSPFPNAYRRIGPCSLA